MNIKRVKEIKNLEKALMEKGYTRKDLRELRLTGYLVTLEKDLYTILESEEKS